jgi:hypothetical protein
MLLVPVAYSSQINIARNPENISTPERTLLLCIASGVDWKGTPDVASVTVAVSVLKGLVERDAVGPLTLSGEGRAAVGMLFKGG